MQFTMKVSEEEFYKITARKRQRRNSIRWSWYPGETAGFMENTRQFVPEALLKKDSHGVLVYKGA